MNFQLPIRFEFQILRDTWSPLVVTPVNWFYDGKTISLRAEIPGRINRGGGQSYVFVNLDHLARNLRPNFKEQRLALLRRKNEAPLDENERQRLTVLECYPAREDREPKSHDVRVLREDFFALKEDLPSLAAFLNHYGAWDSGLSFGRWRFASALLGRDYKRQPSIVSPDYFWQYRLAVRERLERATRNPESWFDSENPLPDLERIHEYPFHVCRIGYVMQAIETSLTLDLLGDVPLSFCAREDCRKPFLVTRTGKTFCCEKCARCVVMRRARASVKELSPERSTE